MTFLAGLTIGLAVGLAVMAGLCMVTIAVAEHLEDKESKTDDH